MPVKCAACNLILCKSHAGSSHACNPPQAPAHAHGAFGHESIACKLCALQIYKAAAFECSGCAGAFCGAHRHAEDHHCSSATPKRQLTKPVMGILHEHVSAAAAMGASADGTLAGQPVETAIYADSHSMNAPSRPTVSVPKPASVGKYGKILHGRSLVRAAVIQATLAHSKAASTPSIPGSRKLHVGFAFTDGQVHADQSINHGWVCADHDWPVRRLMAACLGLSGQDPESYIHWKAGVCIFAERCVSVVTLSSEASLHDESLRCGYSDGAWFVFWRADGEPPKVAFI